MADGGGDLADLVNHPNETLEVELKGWVDLSDKAAKAELAKDLAAIANNGGGYILFGFADSGGPDDRPMSANTIAIQSMGL